VLKIAEPSGSCCSAACVVCSASSFFFMKLEGPEALTGNLLKA
jgi:hypothetical protein